MVDKSDKLVLAKCKKCDSLYIPPVYMCSKCGSTDMDNIISKGEGSILSYTTIRVAPSGFEGQVPYDLGLIGLSEGIHITARIVNPGNKELRIGVRSSFSKKDDFGTYWFTI